MSILALDLGTKCGWSVRDASGRLHSGAWMLTAAEYPNRWLALWDHLEQAHTAHAFTTVVFEDVHRHTGTRAAHVYGGLKAVLEMWVESHANQGAKINLCWWNVATIKRTATGKGNAKKPAMIAAMKARFGDQDVWSDDVADALAVLYTHECGGLPLLAERS